MVRGEAREKRRHLARAQAVRMPPIVMDDEATDPMAVGLFGPAAEVADAAGMSDAIHETGLAGRHRAVWCEGRAKARPEPAGRDRSESRGGRARGAGIANVRFATYAGLTTPGPIRTAVRVGSMMVAL